LRHRVGRRPQRRHPHCRAPLAAHVRARRRAAHPHHPRRRGYARAGLARPPAARGAAESRRAERAAHPAWSRSRRLQPRTGAAGGGYGARVSDEAWDNQVVADVAFEHVAKSYGEIAVIDDLNLRVNDGELMVLVGPSGCGKSTALRMIAGLEEVTRGTISIGGRVVNELAPKDRDIAMVFQNYALYPHMSVRENLAFGLRMRGAARAEIDSRVARAADTLGIAQ